ncbi:MAG TPA: outer membrane protein assembly factor BamA [Syntrophorhabdaceae bacterium]|nr:outer membrane protein assembly factor BamA [Syntrophorhabdaceae bacterium]HQM82709.1 outer membrane protein assembly factor BamA [Syntrophorhabdaceae bacterium]
MKISVTILFLLLILVFCTPASAADAERIARIDVTGNERIDTAFIMNNIKTKERDPYNLDKLQEDMKSIYKTGFFSDVQVNVQDTDAGKTVTFVVIERPPIKAIYLSGNKKLKTADITEKLKIKTNTVLNIERIKESMDEIKKLYSSKGYYATRVNYDIEYGEAYDVTVNLMIDEPSQAYVKKISFTGNKTFKDGKLKDFMRTREKGILSWFTGSGILDDEALEDDRKNLEAFYHDHGYLRVKIGIPDINISQDGKTIAISIPIEEGNVYTVGTINFEGDVIFDEAVLLRNLKSRTGRTFSSMTYQEDILGLVDLYQDKGYAFCDVTPLTLLDDDARKVNLTFNIVKGGEIYFNRINILGNTKTRDKVIRRELKFAEGDRFSSTNLKASKKKLRNTTFFKETDMKLVRTEEPDKVNMDLSVEEKPTGSLSLGIGYSTSEKILLTGNVSQENFFGTGRKVYLDAAVSSVTQEYRLTFVEPYIFDLNLTAGFSIFNFTRILDTYDYQKQGGSVALTRPLTDDVKVATRYRYETTDVYNISAEATRDIWDQAGSSTTSAIGLSLLKNTIDDILNPSIGVNSDVTVEVAGGPVGGSNYFYKVTGFYGQYIPAGFWDTTFFVRGTAGILRPFGGKTLPLYEKFYVGGLNSVRGFRFGEAGPKDINEQVMGAENQLFFNVEWIFPIYKPAGLKGVLFYDAGAGFDGTNLNVIKDSMRTTAGFGIRWFSPMGPIRIEFGYNLFPKTGDRKSAFDFTVGTQY